LRMNKPLAAQETKPTRGVTWITIHPCPIATREAGLAPQLGLATLAGKLRSLVDL